MTLEQTLLAAVIKAIETVGMDEFKKTSLFGSNEIKNRRP